MKDKRSLVKNAGDSEQVRKAEGKVKANRASELRDIAYVINDPAGRRFLWRVLESCRIYETPSGDTNDVMTMIGIQSVGKFLLSEIIATNDEAYILMMREAKEREL